MDERLASAFRVLPEYLGQHVVLSASALALGAVLSLPLALVAAKRPRWRWPFLTTASVIQTIPGLALLALFYPLLLALSALLKPALGLSVPALGFLPALLALTLYLMLPILRNGIIGLSGVDPAVVEAAKGVGMTARQRLLRIEAPLAAPVIMAGVRTSAVWTIGAATLATPVGQTSLGNYIFSGLQTENWISVLFGSIAAAALALIVDQLLGLIEAGASRRDPRRLLAGLAALAFGTALAAVPITAVPRATYVIGSKNFSEQFILSELIRDRLQALGAVVETKSGLGSAVIFRALASGQLDAYVDYSGTLWANVMGRRDTPSREMMLSELTRWMRERYGVTVLGSLGFENAYVLAMKRESAASLGIVSIAELAPHTLRLTLGSDLEFLSRPEWGALKQAYGLAFQAERSFNPTFMFRAVASGEADVISAFSSDGRMAALDLVALTDPQQAIPSYDAVVLLSPARAADPMLHRALEPLLGAIPVARMREANLMVDRDQDKASPAQAARFLAKVLRLGSP